VILLGTGWGARIQIPAFRKSGLEVVSIWARSEEKAQQIAKEHNVKFGTLSN
jgi:predicted dehydrogenase